MKTVAGLVILGAVALAAVFYGLFGGSPQASDDTSELESNETIDSPSIVVEPERLSGEIAFGSLISLGEPLECQLSYQASDIIEPIIGTYFVANGSVRGDFQLTTPEFGQFVSSLITTDIETYTWSTIAGETYGIKTNTQETIGSETVIDSAPIPNSGIVSYECETWEEVDRSIFVPPSNVLFDEVMPAEDREFETGTIYLEGEF